MFNLSTPQTRKIGVVDKLEAQGQSLTVLVFLSCVDWAFAYNAYMRYPDVEKAHFYPIFKVINSWFGLFIFAFMGLFSSHYRKEVFESSVNVSFYLYQNMEKYDLKYFLYIYICVCVISYFIANSFLEIHGK